MMTKSQKMTRIRRVQMIKPNGSAELFQTIQKAAETAGVSPERMKECINEQIVLNGCKWRYINA